MKVPYSKISEDNLLPGRLIEVPTKVLRRGSSSGETLPAPRQQLRRPSASTFDFTPGFQGHIRPILSAPARGARLSCAMPLARFYFDIAEIFIGA
ncbi:MAG TPA: hypothetical protein VK619_12600 [Pyrinomonadaceae bacterium]|nr:hypothetical protein [Pyrinomonadaceae bacterium]